MQPRSLNRKTSEVRVVFKTHLDIGFTDLADRVVARYLKDFIPQALLLARKTRHTPNRFVWTTGSWLPYRFLLDADARGRRAMAEAIAKGDFFWHALPFTTQTELFDPSLFRLGLEFSRRLDQRFGRKTISAKMTDVPGHTRAIVPLLAKAGVRLLHLGVNPASTVPDVPPLFRWKVGEDEVVVIYNNVYGSTTPLPGQTCLSVNLTNDNMGPPPVAEVDQLYAELRGRFPGAKIVAGNLDHAARVLWRAKERLPVVTREIGDTWIHGVGTDPFKVARFRELSRLRLEWIRQGRLKEAGDADLAWGEQLLLVGEHTWGMDIKTHLHDETVWTPRQLQRSLAKPNFREVVHSWEEQREYLNRAVRLLSAPLRTEARRRLKELDRPVRRLRGTSIRPGKLISLGDWRLEVDRTGAIARLQHGRRVLADQSHRLGALTYQTFSAADYWRFFRQYCRLDVDWSRRDFMKWGLTGATARSYRPLVRSLVQVNATQVQEVLAFPAAARNLGAPAECFLTITSLTDGLDLRLEWDRKPANRMPEALWLHFQPRLAATDWRYEKLGHVVDPLDVQKKGNRQLHAVTGPVTTKGFSFRSLDAVLIAPGWPRLLEFTDEVAPRNKGFSSVLYDNLWATNFPMWYSDPGHFRYELRWALSA